MFVCRLHKLKQKHEQMQSVVQRAAMPATEQVSWDDDEGDTPEETNDEETSAGLLYGLMLPSLSFFVLLQRSTCLQQAIRSANNGHESKAPIVYHYLCNAYI